MSKDKDYIKSLGDLSPSKQVQAAKAEREGRENADRKPKSK